MLLFVDLANVFSLDSFVNISNASSHDTGSGSGSGGSGGGGSSVIQSARPNISVRFLPDPPILACDPDRIGYSFIWDVFGIDPSTFSGNAFFICFFFLATQVLSFLTWVAVVLSVLAITWYGILYIISPSKHSDTSKKIIWAVVGLIVSLSAFTLVQLIRYSLFTFNPNLDNISNLSFYWFINKFQFINIAQAYIDGGMAQNNNLSFAYLGEKLILGLGLPLLVSLLALLGLPNWIYNLSNLRLSFCPDLPNVFSSGSIAPNTWSECALSFVYMLIYLLAWVALVLSVIFITWFGVLYIIQPSEAQKTHSRLKYAFIGLIVSLSAITIINLISMLFASVV